MPGKKGKLAVSKAQQSAAAMALQAMNGEISYRDLKGSALQMYSSMNKADLERMAGTSTKALPDRAPAPKAKKASGKMIKPAVKNAVSGAIPSVKSKPSAKSLRVSGW